MSNERKNSELSEVGGQARMELNHRDRGDHSKVDIINDDVSAVEYHLIFEHDGLIITDVLIDHMVALKEGRFKKVFIPPDDKQYERGFRVRLISTGD